MTLVWSEGGVTPTSGWMSMPFERVEFGDDHPTWRGGDFVIMRDVYEVWWEVVNLKTNMKVARALGSGVNPPRRGHG
jgi:hypothetical protein